MNEEHFDMLMRSIKDWNRWRVENPAEGVNLSGADLSWTYLRKADLSGAYLRKANLRKADLRKANLSGSYLSGADLRWADLSGADLRWADLSGADLRWAEGVIQLGPVDDWIGNIVDHGDSIQINFGCRSFRSRDEAAAYWNGKERDGCERPEHDAKMMVGVDALLGVARAHGWKGAK